MSGHQNPDLRPVLEVRLLRAAKPALCLLFLLVPHTAKKPNLTMTGPPRKVGLGK